MQLKRYILCAMMAFATIAISAKNKPQTVYMYGFAASFNDSTVYMTDIQKIDSAYIDSKTHFLYSRNNYSYQLQDYLATKGFDNATCITSFALTRKKAEKKYAKLRKRYTSNNTNIVKNISESDFRYTAIKDESTNQGATQ